MDYDRLKPIAYRPGLGDLQPLMASIEVRGCRMFPAVFKREDGTYAVLAGERRCAALIRLGHREVPAHEIRSWAEFARWMARDTEIAVQLQMPGLAFDPYEAGELANQARTLLEPAKSEWPDQQLAVYTGVALQALRDGRYMVGRYLLDERAEIREAATKAISQVRAGEIAVSTALKSVAKAERELSSGRQPAGPLHQRRAINNAVNQAAGLADGLASIGELSDYLTAEERQEWARALRKSRLAFDRFVKQLEGRA